MSFNISQFINWLTQSQLDSEVNKRRTLVMGILNVTSDSFFDGGCFFSEKKAVAHALDLIECGADIIDIGGESVKPGAIPVPVEEELSRVIPVIETLRQYSDVCISIDTYKPQVMEAAVRAGATMINDIYALRKEGVLSMAAQLKVPVCLMHMQGEPQNMQHNPFYPNGVMNDLMAFFNERLLACEQAGINRSLLILDPGFGFGKRVQDNMELMRQIEELTCFQQPILLGVSRKSTIGAILNQDPSQRLVGSLALAVYASLKGVGILRAHDVNETRQALTMIEAIHQG